MRNTAYARPLCSLLFTVIAWSSHAQSRATCLYSESFASEEWPADWVGLPFQVERLDAQGNGTGEFTAPWRVGNAAQANAGGYFPVPDEPAGDLFVMANDDAPPCDCAMEDVSLFSPFIDLTASTAPAATYRVYHDGRPFNGQASLWASPDGNAWTIVEQIPEVLGQWQQRTVDLAAYAGGSVQLRFRYDDDGNWASGLAVDDICVFERLTNDIALTGAWLGDAGGSAFNSNARSLGYSQIPMEQHGELVLSVRIRNNGLDTATNVQVETSITTDGGTQSSTTILCDALAPLEDTLLVWSTGSFADAPGSVDIGLTSQASNGDEETSDNSAELGYLITSAEVGNHAMALDNDLASTLCGSDEGFSAGCRYELSGVGSTVQGISVRFGAGTQSGSRIHALLMDGNLNLLSSSAGHIVNDTDLALSFSGGSVYIPLDSAITFASATDVLALVRCLPDSGAIRIACGGPVPEGGALLIDHQSFLVSYPGTAPIVRIHLSDPVTGLSLDQTVQPKGVFIAPNPANDHTWVRPEGPMTGTTEVDVWDALGHRVFSRQQFPSNSGMWLDTSAWTNGIYLVQISMSGVQHRARLVVVH